MEGNNYLKGKSAEKIAAEFLINKGYEVLELNYNLPIGEIDIIAKNMEYYVFVEVKYRKNLKNGYPREAVGKTKQNKIKNVALSYIAEKEIGDENFRFDVIEILNNEIEHLENAF